YRRALRHQGHLRVRVLDLRRVDRFVRAGALAGRAAQGARRRRARAPAAPGDWGQSFCRHPTSVRSMPISPRLRANWRPSPAPREQVPTPCRSHELLMRRLAEIYAKKYADPTACDADTAAAAQETLRKVRNAMRSGKPLFLDANDPDRKPHVDE